MTAPITAADYADWCQYAGLYLFNVSHADRYRTYQGKISPAGLATVIVFDFLESNEGGIDLQAWRNMDVYESGPDACYRIEETARSLEAIGARAIAAKMRTVKNTSLGAMFFEQDFKSTMEAMKEVDPAKLMEELRANIARALPGASGPLPEKKPVPVDPEIESREKIEHLLEQHVEAHQAVLRRDYDKHGDVRAEPGFDPQERMAELDRMRQAHYDRETQRESIEKMSELMEEMAAQLAKNPKLKPGKLKARREFVDCYRRYAKRPADELLPELRDCLAKADRFQDEHAAIFRPQPTDDAALLDRLAKIGAYDVDQGSKNIRISWDAPSGLACDWTRFSLSMEWPASKKKSLAMLVAAYDRLCKNFEEAHAELRRQVLEHFEMLRLQLEEIGLLDDYERDEDDNITEASILKNAGDGSIHMHLGDADDDSIAIDVYFSVEWDEEHGLELALDDTPPEPAAAEPTALPTNVRFEKSGPPVAESALTAFEKKHDLKLPVEYRQFLAQHDGGIPEPNKLTMKMEGSSTPITIESLHGLAELEGAIEQHRASGFPPQYLPIGSVHMPSPFGGNMDATLLIGVSGKKSGKVFIAYQPTALMMPGMAAPEHAVAMAAQMYESLCFPAAPSFNSLLAKLAPGKEKKLPAWLQAIRANDANAFAAWLEAKGKFDEQYVPEGEMRLLTVLDYLALEASPELLKPLLDRGRVKPQQLRSRWQRWDGKLGRFKELMALLGKDQLRFAFTSPGIWGDAAMLDRLLAAGINLDFGLDDEGATPLHFAIRCRCPDGVRWLLAHGASPKKADDHGRTPLIWAESERELESMKLLLEAGESLESLFPHMATLRDKLRLIKGRWAGQFDALAEYLRNRGVVVEE